MPNKKRAKAGEGVAFKSRAGTNPRSRAGCLTCKAKHTKCDETRPECLRCTRKGIKCGGYWREFKWSFKHQPESSTSTSTSSRDAPDNFINVQTNAVVPARRTRTPVPRNRRDSESISSEASAPTSIPSSSSGTDDQNGDENGPPSIDVAIEFGSLDLPALLEAGSSSPRRRPSGIVGGVSLDPEYDIADSALMSAGFLPEVPLFMTAPFTDTSSLLITNWFERVCPAWSGFDSPANLNRKLATELWHESQSVFSSLQSMSAAFLSTRMPHMRQPATRLLQTAIESIQAEVRTVKSRVYLDTIPIGLLFSLFCVGTSVCWVDTNQLGLPFFREARLLLQRLNRRLPPFYEKDTEMLSFFNKCLAYCEMLLAVVTDVDPIDDNQAQVDAEMECNQAVGKRGVDDYIHPWTGISTATSRLFTKSIRLCRKYRHSLRQKEQVGARINTDFAEMSEAKRLEEKLLELEFPSMPQSDDTGDQKTPYFHLAKIAEAYQLAALLHLYQTFPDLVSLRLPINSTTLYGGNATWEEWIIPLSLRLTRVMEHIPPSSGSRAIQPLLYISASTGLRYDTSAPFDLLDLPWTSGLSSLDQQFPPFSDTPNPFQSSSGVGISQAAALGPGLISQLSLDISNARHFIMGRLNILENTLPPKPVKVAKKLIRAVWDAYDNELPGCTKVHWVDVMEDNNLRTMFG